VIGRYLGYLIGLFAGICILAIAQANRHVVQLGLDPFDAENPVIAIHLPFYGYLLGMLITGVLLGGAATWFTQRKWRRTARQRTQESIRYKAEADRLVRERDAAAASQANTGRNPALSAPRGEGRTLALSGR
jgi:uncharacterized integral membrane protein